jgi:hypothetical protein
VRKLKGAGVRLAAIALATAGILVFQVVGGSAAAERPATHTKTASLRRAPSREQFEPKSLLVKFKAGASLAERKTALTRHGATLRTLVHGTPFSLVRVADAARARPRSKASRRSPPSS